MLSGEGRTLMEICNLMNEKDVENIETMIMLYKIRELGILDESVSQD